MCQQNTTVNSVLDDVQSTNAVRQYRKTIGSTQQTRYPYNWWQATLVLLTYVKPEDGLTTQECEDIIRDDMGMDFNVNATYLVRATQGYAPGSIRRSYTNTLPALLKDVQLKYELGNGLGCGPSPYIFYFKNTIAARNILVTQFPHLMPLFVEFDRLRRIVN